MQYTVAHNDQGVTVALSGQLNFAANDIFAGLLKELDVLRSARVTFDMSGLSHIDSVGLGLLYIAQEELEHSGSKMCLASPRGGVKRLLDLTEAAETFDIRP